jgi:hypothetical protein
MDAEGLKMKNIHLFTRAFYQSPRRALLVDVIPSTFNSIDRDRIMSSAARADGLAYGASTHNMVPSLRH